MKLTILIMTVFLLQVSALTKAQITLREESTTLQKVLKSISKQSGYDFVYSNTAFKNLKPVTVNLNNASIETALQVCFEDQPLEYEISDKTVMVKRKDKARLLNPTINHPQTINIRGKVVGENGQGLAGANVSVKSGTKSTTTDKEGNFYLANVDYNAVLVVSFIGYLSKEINANADLSNIRLEISNSKLDEVQIQAYGTTTKRFLTSNIGSVKGEDIAKQPVSNPLLALQGRIPGLYIQQTSGNTIGSVNVTIQGPNSLASGNNPFYVIDGVPYINDNRNGLEGSLLATGGNTTLNFINPNDIESVEILKDADATAIYGSRAANGAILITTKRGKAGTTKVDVNIQSGFGKITRTYTLLNTAEYVALRKEGLLNDNRNIAATDYDINGVWDQNKNTNWQKVLAGKTAQLNNISTSISGGNKNTQFRAGAGYLRQTTVYPGNFVDKKANVHISLNHQSENEKFNFSFSGNFLQDKNVIPVSDPYSSALLLAPNAPDLYNIDGTINWSPLPSNPNIYTYSNPASGLERKNSTNTSNIIGSANFNYKIFEDLIFKTTLGYNRLENNANLPTPFTFFKPDASFKTRSARFSNSTVASWIVEPQLNYKHLFPFGQLEVMLGGTTQETKTNLLTLNASGFTNDAQLPDPRAASSITVSSSVQNSYRYSGIFGRINYRLKDRYIFSLNSRNDGTSRFGSSNRFHTFYSIAGAWIFSEEPSLKKIASFINSGKIRVSYGTTGNDQIGDYSYLSLYDNQSYLVNYQNTVGLQPSGIPNPYLEWEETRKLNLGFDLTVLNSRLDFSLNYFRNRSSNQILYTPIPSTTGFLNIYTNLPAKVQNTGIEILVKGDIKNSKLFSWNMSGNLTIPRNKLIEFENLATSIYSGTLVIGEPITLTKVYTYAGVNQQTGLYQFMATNGQLTSTPSFGQDRNKIVTTLPNWYAGLSSSFTYRNWGLDLLFQYVNKTRQIYRFVSVPGRFNNNQPAILLNRWRSPGDIQLSQKATTLNTASFDAVTGSDAVYGNGNFLRVKNITLSYLLPPSILQKVNISQAKICMTGQNMFTATKFEGDPETGTGSLPSLKMYSLGIQVTF